MPLELTLEQKKFLYQSKVRKLKIIEAILKGERDKETLLSMCHISIIKNKKEEVLKSLNGKYTNY